MVNLEKTECENSLMVEALKFLNEDGSEVLSKNDKQFQESAVRGEYTKGERGGEEFWNSPNDYTRAEALHAFAMGAGASWLKDGTEEEHEVWLKYNAPKRTEANFERTFAKFEEYRKGKPIRLYRGIILKDGEPVDDERKGECWSMSRNVSVNWVDGIWDNMVYKHIVNGAALEKMKKYLFVGTTTLDNCRLLYSFFLAGRFERNEWEVRLKDEKAVRLVSKKELE